jgi:hypothetical protein
VICSQRLCDLRSSIDYGLGLFQTAKICVNYTWEVMLNILKLCVNLHGSTSNIHEDFFIKNTMIPTKIEVVYNTKKFRIY